MVKRGERLQVMLTEDELRALDDWRFKRRMPTRAAAIRELLKRGLGADGWESASGRGTSTEFGVIDDAGGTSQKALNGSGKNPAK